MMRWPVTVLALAAVACAAPAARQAPVQQVQPQPAFDPAGTYDFTAEFQGQTVPGTLHLRRSEQGLAGSLVTGMSGELPFSSIAMDGRRAELRAATPQGDLIMRLEWVDDDVIRVGWELAGVAAGSASGRRRR
jgi:hypothetical protein